MAHFRDWMRQGRPLIWLSGGALALSVLMIASLVGILAVRGLGFFWPKPIVQVQGPSGPILGEVVGREPTSGSDPATVQFRVGNRDFFGQDFLWVPEHTLSSTQCPQDAVLVERLEYGPFIGMIQDVREGETLLAEGPTSMDTARRFLSQARARRMAVRDLEKGEIARINLALEELRLERAALKLRGGTPEECKPLEAREASLQQRYAAAQSRADLLRSESRIWTITLRAIDGQTKTMSLGDVVRVVPANALGTFGKLRVYLSRFWEFVADDPRESNTEGGILPAIFGTVMMVMLMSALVVPIGVLAALYLREYAKQGLLVRIVRIAVNNLAGVPSIVFGLFGLGFFIYGVGGSLDAFFFSNKLPAPTFGTGGILWASLTLALLTVPVVIVATEEALASVRRSQREASLALGATKWQTMWKVVLPGATPGILTGLILAMARGAGEVAPLMLTGAVKLAPAMPLDGTFPYLHLDRKFMHLGFHIYDVGFQSPNSEAAKPMVFLTALLLLGIVLLLNLAALRLRQKLRARMTGSAF